MTSYLDTIAARAVIYDGATGTWLQTQDLTADDFGGDTFEGCNHFDKVLDVFSDQRLATREPDLVDSSADKDF